MLKTETAFDDDHDPVAPGCRATVDTIQLVLDGERTDTLDADPHANACATCRARVRAARVLLSVLAAPGEQVPVPAHFTDKVMTDVWGVWHARRRYRVYKVAAVFALAAAVLIAAFVISDKPVPTSPRPFPLVPGVPPDIAKRPEAAPSPREKTHAPERPIRIGDEVAKAGQAFRDTQKPFADSVAVAPKLFDAFATAFNPPAEPVLPMGTQLEPARKSLAELPDAARSGLEPVTETAQKAFSRLLRDVASVKPKS